MTSLEPISTAANRRSRFDVEVQPSLLLEALLVMWSALGGDEKVEAHELGKRWFDDVRRRIPADLAEVLVTFGGDNGKIWMTCFDWVASAPDPADTEGTLIWMQSSGWEERRRAVLGEMCWRVDATDLDAAASGESDAIARCLVEVDEAERESMERWLCYPAERFPSLMASVLRRVLDEVLPEETGAWADIQRSSVAAVRPLVDIMEPADLVERVTNGISYPIPLGVRRLVLVPSVSLRPWTVTHEMGDTIYVFYPVADEHIDLDPGAPPLWLVRFHKALGDERRMRMLRRLAEGPAGLAELTETIALAKSTVFHHVGILRAAGLLRVHVATGRETGPTYSLRREALSTAAEFTDLYLCGDRKGDTT
jgi:DNA-binding transcriptional ArsR family regulator